MLYSDDRMKYIIEYLSAYKQKIELANKNGLLDNAKMFELFAEQVCKLYYNMDFYNLNNIHNYLIVLLVYFFQLSNYLLKLFRVI